MAGILPSNNRIESDPSTPEKESDLPIYRKPSKLTAANEWFRRKVDKITTPMLRAISNDGEAGYQSEDIVTGERFYLTVNEVKQEITRRQEVAFKLAGEMYEAYCNHADWKSVKGEKLPPWNAVWQAETRDHWKAAAEFVIEKYRCLL